MPSIDERIVAMAFENRVFEQRVAATMTTLGKLDASIKNLSNAKGLENIETSGKKVTLQAPMSALDKLKGKLSGAWSGATSGFDTVERAASRLSLTGPNKAFDSLQQKMARVSAGTTFTDIERASDRVELAGLSRAIQNVSGQFSVLQGAATVAFGNIASQAAMRGAAFAKSFAFEPIKQGFDEYQTNLGSIQTILSNTADSGGNLKTVNAALGELNTYSDKTIYNFSEMARNIGTFTAAGVQLKPATAAIKGIANLAALSGSNSQQASTAMYQLSQAIASGRVGLQDWNSVVNAGMGGAVFQKSLMRTAENMGALKKGAVEIDKATGKATVNGKSFRDSIMAKPGQQSWLTSDVLTSTLSQLTGDMTDAQLAAKGFTTEQIKAIQAQAKSAQDAATQVKTLPQVFDVAKETIGSGWSQTFQTIFGDFGESKKTFTDMSNFINGFINRTSQARNKMLTEWKTLGGRTALLGGLKDAFAGLSSLVKPIQDAFRQIFPPTTGKQLFEMTVAFRNFAKSLTIDPGTAENIKRTFAGIFAVFDIAKRIIGGVIGVIFDLIGVVGKGGGSFLNFTGGIGDFLVAIDQALAQGTALSSFFSGLSAVLKLPLKLISALAGAILNLFTGSHADAAAGLNKSLDEVNARLGPLKAIANAASKAWGAIVDLFGRAKTALSPWFDQMVNQLSGLGDILANALKNLDFEKIMSGVQTGLVAGLLVTLKKAIGGGVGGVTVFGDAFKGVNSFLDAFRGNLEALQQNVKANTLLQIGAAVLVLAAGIKILSTINGPDLTRSMTAVAVGLGELMGAMKLMTMGMGKLGFAQLPLIAASIIGLSVAIVILAGAMKIFATMKWQEIAKGLAGVAGSLAAIGVGMKLMPAGPLMVIQAAGLVLIGAALNIIAAAIKQFGALDMATIAKGLFTMVEALGGIALGVSLMPPTLPLTAAGLILMGIALSSVGMAIKSMGSLDVATIVKGLGTMMAAIAGIGLAISLVPPTIALSAAGLLIVGQAMVVTAGAIALLGGLSVGTLVKGIVGLAAALIVLAGGLTLMIVSLPGSLALMAAAAALAVLVPVLGLLGVMKWSTIFKGLAAIALVLATVGVAGLIAAPALLALGLALIPLGLGLIVVATAAKIFAGALSVLSADGQKGAAVMLAAFTGFVALLPTILLNLIKGMLDVVGQVASLAPKVVQALGVVIDMLIAFVIEAAPKLAQAIGVLVQQFAVVIARDSPKLVQSGITLVMSLLNGIAQNIGQITDKVSQIVSNFLSALQRNMPSIIEAGASLLRKFLGGISSRFGEIAAAVGTLIARFAAAVGSQAQKIVTAAATMMGNFIGALATYGPTLALKGAQVILDFLQGISNKGPELIKKGVSVAGKLVKGIGDGLVNLADMGLKAIIRFLNGLEAAIRANTDPLINAGAGVGDAIMDGIVKAFGRGGALVRKALEAVFTLMPGWAKKVLGIKSPSRVFAEIGDYTMQGFVKGVEDSKPRVRRGVEDVGVYSMQGMAKGIKDNQNLVTNAALGAGNAMVSGVRKLLGIRSPSEVFRDIGMNVNHGFRDGLLGSRDEVLSAFDSMNSSLIDKIRDLRTQVADGNTKVEDLQQQHADKIAEIAKLRGEKKPDTDAIATAVKESQDLEKQIGQETASVDQNGRALARAREIRKSLTGSMHDEKLALLGLKKDYEDITKQLETATETLNQITQDRQQAQDKYAQSFNQTPDIDSLVSDALAQAEMTAEDRRAAAQKAADDAEKKRKIDQVALYKQALQEQIVATQKYQDTLQKLRGLGLDDATYTKLLDKGLAGQDFASQLLASGKSGVDQINALDAQMLQKATDLAKQAADNLYNAGIAAAQGLVDGLTKKKGELDAAMTALADTMVNAIKSKLKIRSPSRIFAEIGQFTAEGLAQGLQNSTQTVTGAAQALGDDATAALRGSLSHILDNVSNEVDPKLVVTPVLDLTQFRKDASGMSIDNVVPITAATSYGQAAAASQEVSASQQAALEAAAAAAKPSVSFEQNNYSPEALSDVEIYRKTRNQIGQLKSALGVPA